MADIIGSSAGGFVYERFGGAILYRSCSYISLLLLIAIIIYLFKLRSFSCMHHSKKGGERVPVNDTEMESLNPSQHT